MLLLQAQSLMTSEGAGKLIEKGVSGIFILFLILLVYYLFKREEKKEEYYREMTVKSVEALANASQVIDKTEGLMQTVIEKTNHNNMLLEQVLKILTK